MDTGREVGYREECARHREENAKWLRGENAGCDCGRRMERVAVERCGDVGCRVKPRSAFKGLVLLPELGDM